MSIEKAREIFVEWLARRMTYAGRGDSDDVLNVEPAGKYWLGRLQSAEAVAENGWGDRGERLEPCAIGIKVKCTDEGPWRIEAGVTLRVWLWNERTQEWRKSPPISALISGVVNARAGKQLLGADEVEHALKENTGASGLSGRIEVEAERGEDGRFDLTICFVNTSPKVHDHFRDTRFYECEMRLNGFSSEPFMLEALEDTFRYDRRVIAYGVNCGVRSEGEVLITEDAITVDRSRPVYWNSGEEQPAMTFASLGNEPCKPARALLSALESWGEESWTGAVLAKRAIEESWSAEMVAKAEEAAKEFAEEVERIRRGIELLESTHELLTAFKLMNKAMDISANGKYDSWRPFQFGFLLANIASIVREDEAEIADVVWFATGGGKTETYLGLILTAAFHDRLTGKTSGMTAWSRFPLRMLSLQQTQRFADALAAAELVRRRADIEGDPFSLGFFVGQGATPNKVPEEPKENEPDPDDDNMPERYRTLDYCPFCRADKIKMIFDRKHWRLAHCCTNAACSWGASPLPVFIVDEEIYRFLPTVVVGTLDKAASISLQASMRGLVGAPLGKCPQPGHGYTYMPRSNRPKGCLVPGCQKTPLSLDMEAERFGPTFRLQDELHLLRDSLGAVDSHYEALYDDLQIALGGRKPKILASSATLTGYEKQVDVLYRRAARVFPVPPPKMGGGFWTSDSDQMMRKFLAIAPRGVTIEYTVDRLLTELQAAIRYLVADPEKACAEIGVDKAYAYDLISNYGTDVVYGNTLRDLEAVVRSVETQVQVEEGEINTASLTGKTEFSEVRAALNRLQKPEDDFQKRLHIISASSMMSHGVDVDRLNVMVMLGLPLSAAEFIQATARVGRRYPSLVFVIHKIGRERDAGIFRAFPEFIRHGDRFVDPIPITKRSRRVLEKTMAGMELARIRILHETLDGPPLTTVKALREYVKSGRFDISHELKAVIDMLQLNDELDEALVKDIQQWFDRLENNIESPPADAKFISHLSPTGDPMLSLRDVEKQVPVVGSRVDGR